MRALIFALLYSLIVVFQRCFPILGTGSRFTISWTPGQVMIPCGSCIKNCEAIIACPDVNGIVNREIPIN
jgi:hypothetical protein